MKIGPGGTELFHTDGQTYMIKLTVAFCSSAKAPKKSGVLEKRSAFDTAALNGKMNQGLFQLRCSSTSGFSSAAVRSARFLKIF
jgi:hypothetical protein